MGLVVGLMKGLLLDTLGAWLVAIGMAGTVAVNTAWAVCWAASDDRKQTVQRKIK
jgi:hypothetical protein